MMKALVTGFDPFGGGRMNASLEAVRRLPPRIGSLDLVTAALPTSYARSIPALKGAIRDARPGIVLCVGEAGERSLLSVERVAVNLQDARIPDNDGAAPADRPVVRGGPAAYFSTLPVRRMVAGLRAAELPAELSTSAGTFVCNHAFYGLMHLAAATKRSFRGGFLHVPCLAQKQGTATPLMVLDDIVRGIVICLEAAEESVTQ
ncbi:MAG: pyroglutamyl-peptidase I [Burkholderiales bacterium]